MKKIHILIFQFLKKIKNRKIATYKLNLSLYNKTKKELNHDFIRNIGLIYTLYYIIICPKNLQNYLLHVFNLIILKSAQKFDY